MIIHFVAYPNSKDYLLLQTLYKVFGIPWYEADIADQTDLKVTAEEEMGGYRSAGEPWRTFFDRHNSSKSSLLFARTRRLPQDDLPFVYVSRHPASIFMDTATARQGDSLGGFSSAFQSDILGIGEQPDWSAHYAAWKGHKEKISGYFVRVEDFCADTVRTLVKIAVRLHLPKPQQIEENNCILPPDRLEEFHAIDPELKNMLLAFHGEVMCELGYLQPSIAAASHLLEKLPPGVLARAIASLRNECNISKQKANAVQSMASYIQSLENQYKQETGNLINRINRLTKESAS